MTRDERSREAPRRRPRTTLAERAVSCAEGALGPTPRLFCGRDAARDEGVQARISDGPEGRRAVHEEIRAGGVKLVSVLRQRPDQRQTHGELHAGVWPSGPAMLRKANVTNDSIFLPDGLPCSYLEYTGDDDAADLVRIAADPRTQLTDPCQQPLDTTAEGEWRAPAEEVFHAN